MADYPPNEIVDMILILGDVIIIIMLRQGFMLNAFQVGDIQTTRQYKS